MRSNIFLHFLNRDSREIYGLYSDQPLERHANALWRATNAAVLLCEDYCVIPPGFAIECDIAFAMFEKQEAFLREKLIQMPLRDASLGDFAEKKRREYSGMRKRYRGLFDERRLEFLSKNAEGLIPRKAKIAEAISDGWLAAADQRRGLWEPIKSRLGRQLIDEVRLIPQRLVQDESAATWEAIQEHLPAEARMAADDLRRSLQNIYFREYMREFRLVVMRGSPLMHDDFGLRSDPLIYDYKRFQSFLRAFELDGTLLQGAASFLVSLKRRPGFYKFLDSYAALGRASSTLATMQFRASTVAARVKFDWPRFERRHRLGIVPSEIEVIELADAVGEAADILSREFNLQADSRDALISLPSDRSAARLPLVSSPNVTAHPEARDARVLIVTALPAELAAVLATADRHETLGSRHDPTIYHLAVYETPKSSDRVAIVCRCGMGKVSASTTAAHALRSFPNVEHIVMVGIAGGCPNPNRPEEHVRLGDIVISGENGIIEYDFVKETADERIIRRFPQKPSKRLLNCAEELRASAMLGNRPWEAIIRERVTASENFVRPSTDHDVLHDAQGNVISHRLDPKRSVGMPSLRVGVIATADTLQKNPQTRDMLRDKYGVRAIEMEASGMQDAAWAVGKDVFVVRGVCDYCDALKNDEWQGYAALVAASFTRSLIEIMPAEWFGKEALDRPMAPRKWIGAAWRKLVTKAVLSLGRL